MFKKMLLLVSMLTATSAFAIGFSPQSLNDVSSITQQADGSFSVMCMNGTNEVVSASDIMANNLCPYMAPVPMVLLPGTYRDMSNNQLCDQTTVPTYVDGSLTHLYLGFPGCGGDFFDAECVNNVCEQVILDQQITVEVLSSTSYRWTNNQYGDVSIFERIGDRTVKTVIRKSSQKGVRAGGK